MSIDQARESRIRSRARRRGYRLIKSRSRTPRHSDFGTFGVVDDQNSLVLSAYSGTAYGCTLDAIEQWLDGGNGRS